MIISNEDFPIEEPYSEAVSELLEEKWCLEKERLVEQNVTLPALVEPLARRVFYDGVVSGLNNPPY